MFGALGIWLLVIMNKDLLSLLNKAYFFLKFRPRSEKEVRDYLYKKIKNKHWSRDDADKVLGELKEEDLIDDKKFIDWFVRARSTLKPKGQRVLTRELKQKGIADELIEKYFSENTVDEEGLALKILEKRWPRYRNLDSRKRFEKACRFLMSRGFNYDLIKQTINKMGTN
ncbi:hypothetical protein COY13_01910 [Candidatus Roizmanbacteria bacterium CG_4_10_14_0_2_um_filter_36_35]|uniref:Regulatory protein RecX n=4 Tax=Candidatus Roizmaniibacteriota TaxID=1752723 RepID=A0A2M7UA24_9BACT|nr:MAG: hypothetical protein COV86_02450 [Candidatus Roizmanbacteria bacterium CG11_big_fil_rev_8_21_14_0_20_35_14]PIZ68085.1 MAG: hypothetical protein COY13_01910 [Candidatus Roizmanbacteria bacterium CG_4_10_14_0_2_um_filter_36_35]PJC80634.1 MAG: hypothetical protein CO008_01430 [Candidatus Roizmanbacteria bacterium CG_4_8_14_3_um_filter_36_12]